MLGVNMKKMFNVPTLAIMACCISIAYGTSETPTTSGTTQVVSKKITDESLDKLAEQLVTEHKYNTTEYPSLIREEYKHSIKAAIKAALRENASVASKSVELTDVFDNVIGNPEAENYLILRFLCKYMILKGTSVDDTIRSLRKMFEERIDDIEIFAKVANVEGLLTREPTELINKLLELTPNEPIEGAKDIFEFMAEQAGSVKNYEEVCSSLFGQIPRYDTTEMKNVTGDLLDVIVNEQQAENVPIAINWRTSDLNAGVFQKYVPELFDNLNNASNNAKKSNKHLLSRNVTAVINKNGTGAKHDIDLITSHINNNFPLNDQSWIEMARMQSIFAVISKHDVLIIDISGLHIPQNEIDKIRNIYKNELANPLIKGKLKKVLFVISNSVTDK